MKKYIIFTIYLIGSISLGAQTLSSGITVFDTRDIDDLPNFNKKAIRADFKSRSTIGVPGIGIYSSNVTISPWFDKSGNLNHQLNFNDGGIYYRQGHFDETTWRTWSKVLLDKGNQSITGNLDINGIIRTKEVRIEATGWADFVFNKEYQLPTLSEVENHIKEYNHLPDIPSESEVLKDGISVGEMQIKLLQKIEELTLYVIDLKKENEKQESRIQVLEKENQKLKNN